MWTRAIPVEPLAIAAHGLGVTATHAALAWLRDRPGVTAPAPGARTVAQLGAALGVEEFSLPGEITQALDDVSASAGNIGAEGAA